MNKSILSFAVLGGLVAVTAASAEAPRSGIGNDRTGNTVSSEGMKGNGYRPPNSDMTKDGGGSGIVTHNNYDRQAANSESTYQNIEPAAGPISTSNKYGTVPSAHTNDIEFGG